MPKEVPEEVYYGYYEDEDEDDPFGEIGNGTICALVATSPFTIPSVLVTVLICLLTGYEL